MLCIIYSFVGSMCNTIGALLAKQLTIQVRGRRPACPRRGLQILEVGHGTGWSPQPNPCGQCRMLARALAMGTDDGAPCVSLGPTRVREYCPEPLSPGQAQLALQSLGALPQGWRGQVPLAEFCPFAPWWSPHHETPSQVP